jgi:hypothetical protein
MFIPGSSNYRLIGRSSCLITALLAATALAVDICTVPPSDTGCNEGLAELCCGNIGSGTCCDFGGPPATRMLIGNLPEHASGFVYPLGDLSCSDPPADSCRTGGAPGVRCCLSPGPVLNAAIWTSGTSKIKARVEGSARPNMVKYVSASGEQRQATIPDDGHELASNAIASGNYTLLFDSWPEYNN